MKQYNLYDKKNINLSVKFTKQERKAFKVIIERFEKGLATWLKDLKPSVKDQSNTAVRKLASRLVQKGICKFKSRGIIIPTGYDDDKELMDKIDLSILTKARSVKERKAIIHRQKSFIKSIRPFLTSKQNKWSELLTHNINAKFSIEGNEKLYEYLKKLAREEPRKKKDSIMILVKDPTAEYRIMRFHVYSHCINLQIGTTDSPVKADEESFKNVVNISRNYLITIDRLFWQLHLNIPPIDEWNFTVAHLHHDTINKDYMAYDGGGTEDYGLAIHLYNHIKKGRNCLRLEVKLTKIPMKLKDISDFFEKNDHFKTLQNRA